MKVDDILKEFVNDCINGLDLIGIIQIGSSNYLKRPDDIDLVFFSKDSVLRKESIKKLILVIKKFEDKYNEIAFNFSGADRKRDGKYNITIVFLGESEFKVKYNPHDLFFFKNLTGDKNIRILYGLNPLTKLKIKLTNQHLLEMLSVDLKHALRRSLDDDQYRLEAFYHLFKTFLRAMLINDGVFRKDELVSAFAKKYSGSIKLPKESGRVLNHTLKKEDFDEILEFCEGCLNYLATKSQ
ncbi:MAG: hypothetical protein AABX85_04895 [Nanoarchaeota archaeon]